MKLSKATLYFIFATLFSLAIGMMIHLDLFLEVLSDSISYEDQQRALQRLFQFFPSTFLVAFFTFTINYFILRPLDGGQEKQVRRFIYAVVLTIISVYVLSDIFFSIRMGRGLDFDFGFEVNYFLKDLILSAIILGGIFSIKILYDKQQYEVENERLVRENLLSRYEALKTQVSPHFLFNSLSALKALIAEDKNAARNYLDHLSDVLRNTLQKRDNQTVTIGEELELLDSYLYLIKMRYAENLQIDISIPPKYRVYRIPQLALQTLVENAVKHNVISRKKILEISIYIQNEHLIVRNTRHRKQHPEEGTGIGLPNLSSQYKLINGAEIHISQTADQFQVALPLLTPTEHESISG